MALWRASASVTLDAEPNPIEDSRPATVKRKIHEREPVGLTRSQSPFPSPCLPGLALATFRDVSLCATMSVTQIVTRLGGRTKGRIQG